MQGQTFVFFGIAGSGKGTQVKLLTDFLTNKDGKEVVYMSPGNEYRKLVQLNTQTASLVKVILDKGGLLPDFLTDSVIANILINNISEEKHLIVDGYPRTIPQSESLEEAIKFYQRINVKVVYLKLSKEEATKRLEIRARHDDTNEGIAKRFDDYTKNVVPSMNYFKDKDGYELITINGDQSVEKVHADIISALNL